MGANFNTMTLDGNLTERQVVEHFGQVQERDRYERGHSYSGGFGMATGLSFDRVPTFASVEAAEEWLCDHAQKWENARAVRATIAATDYAAQRDPVRKGAEVWVIGAWCAS